MARQKITQTIAVDLPDLTPNQYAFVEGLLAGKTASDSYRAAYSCENASDRTIWAEASRLRNCPKVSAWLTAARQAHLGKATVTLDEHLRELERLKEIAISTGNVGAAVQAEQLRGKAAGHYVEQVADVTIDPIRTLQEIAELSPELADALAKHHGIVH